MSEITSSAPQVSESENITQSPRERLLQGTTAYLTQIGKRLDELGFGANPAEVTVKPHLAKTTERYLRLFGLKPDSVNLLYLTKVAKEDTRLQEILNGMALQLNETVDEVARQTGKTRADLVKHPAHFYQALEFDRKRQISARVALLTAPQIFHNVYPNEQMESGQELLATTVLLAALANLELESSQEESEEEVPLESTAIKDLPEIALPEEKTAQKHSRGARFTAQAGQKAGRAGENIGGAATGVIKHWKLIGIASILGVCSVLGIREFLSFKYQEGAKAVETGVAGPTPTPRSEATTIAETHSAEADEFQQNYDNGTNQIDPLNTSSVAVRRQTAYKGVAWAFAEKQISWLDKIFNRNFTPDEIKRIHSDPKLFLDILNDMKIKAASEAEKAKIQKIINFYENRLKPEYQNDPNKFFQDSASFSSRLLQNSPEDVALAALRSYERNMLGQRELVFGGKKGSFGNSGLPKKEVLQRKA